MSNTSFQGWFRKDIQQQPKPVSSKTARKGLSKRLKANQLSNRYIHIMDGDMFDTIKQMFNSEDPASKLMAKDIVLKSRLNEEQINYFVTKHLYSLI